jgi:hypothetical protein
MAHWYAFYAFGSPIEFAMGYLAHLLVGFSPGEVIMLAVIAPSNSDISGPPTLWGGIPMANSSVYIGTSTGLGTVVAIALCIPLFIALGRAVFSGI